jgi:hypothetical protein
MPVRKKIAGLDYRAAGIAGAAGLGPGVGGSRGDCGCVGATVAPAAFAAASVAFAAASVVDFTSPGLWTLGLAHGPWSTISIASKPTIAIAEAIMIGPRPFPF